MVSTSEQVAGGVVELEVMPNLSKRQLHKQTLLQRSVTASVRYFQDRHGLAEPVHEQNENGLAERENK